MNTRVLGYSYRRLRPDYLFPLPLDCITQFKSNGPGVKDYFLSRFTLVTFRVSICIIRLCLHRGTVSGVIPPDPLPDATDPTTECVQVYFECNLYDPGRPPGLWPVRRHPGTGNYRNRPRIATSYAPRDCTPSRPRRIRKSPSCARMELRVGFRRASRCRD